MGEKIAPTAAEAKWIAELKAVARKRPRHLWLFSASGTLCVMRGRHDGEHIHLEKPHGFASGNGTSADLLRTAIGWTAGGRA